MTKSVALKLLEEKLDLHGNMVRLQKFLDNPENTRDINPRELDFMYEQLEGMQRYYGALNWRSYYHANGTWPDESNDDLHAGEHPEG